MAEYYHILNYKEQSPVLIAILLSGLRNESRVQMAMSGQKLKIEQVLLATIADELSSMLWTGKEDRPESFLAILLGESKKDENQCLSFNSAKSFEEWWNSH